MIRALLDTSIVIAAEETLPLAPGDSAAISVITIGELQTGVRLANDPEVRAVRQARLSALRSMFEPLPIDDVIAIEYGELLAFARSQDRSTKATDLLIVATASATGRTLLTLDEPQAALARAAELPVNP